MDRIQEAISKLIRRALPERCVSPALFFVTYRRDGLMQAYGYGASLKRRLPCDAVGAPLPWIPYWIGALIDERLPKQSKVFEYGSGASTLFLMSRAAQVDSVEHSEAWLDELRPKTAANVRLLRRPPVEAEYVGAISASGAPYDLVLVDGLFRVSCVRTAATAISERGVIVLDDSQRASYCGAFSLAKAAGFRELRIKGHKPGSVGIHEATIFYRPDNILGL